MFVCSLSRSRENWKVNKPSIKWEAIRYHFVLRVAKKVLIDDKHRSVYLARKYTRTLGTSCVHRSSQFSLSFNRGKLLDIPLLWLADVFTWVSIYFQGQGVAYRGRALVELETKLDTQPTKMVEEVLNDDIIRVQVCVAPAWKKETIY